MIAGVAPLNPTDTYTYTNYTGSLTTPGCAEIVYWINFLKPLTISKNQLKLFRGLKNDENANLFNNFRPTQPLNNRKVITYGRN